MKIAIFNKHNFQELSQLDRIEYILRKSTVVENIKKSIPVFEIITILIVLAYSRLHSLLIYAAFGVNSITISFVNYFSIFFNTIIVMFFISFIARIIIYFQKHRQLNELHEEFLDRLKVQEFTNIKNDVGSKKIKKLKGCE